MSKVVPPLNSQFFVMALLNYGLQLSLLLATRLLSMLQSRVTGWHARA